MKAIIFIFSAILLLLSCNSDEEIVKKKELPKDDLEIISSDFEGTEFKDPIHLELLKELDICDTMEVEGSNVAPCSAENFKFMKFNDNAKLEDAFLLPAWLESGWVIKNRDDKGESRYDFQFVDKQGYKVTLEGLSRTFVKVPT